MKLAKKSLLVLSVIALLSILGACSKPAETLESLIPNKTYSFTIIESEGSILRDKYGIIHFTDDGTYFYNTSDTSEKDALKKFDEKNASFGGLEKRKQSDESAKTYTISGNNIVLSNGINMYKEGKNISDIEIIDNNTISGKWGQFLSLNDYKNTTVTMKPLE